MKARTFVAMLLLSACSGTDPRPVPVDPASERRMLEEENRRALRQEERDITDYMQRNGIHAHISGTGVRWWLLRDLAGDTVRPEQRVVVNYVMRLIDGSTAYASEPGRPESFRVEHDDVESGLHEAVQHLSPGDSALIIIPSHRAFGLIGDMRQVPPRSTVIYHIGLVDVREP